MKDVLDEDSLICLQCGREFHADNDSECYEFEICSKCWEKLRPYYYRTYGTLKEMSNIV